LLLNECDGITFVAPMSRLPGLPKLLATTLMSAAAVGLWRDRWHQALEARALRRHCRELDRRLRQALDDLAEARRDARDARRQAGRAMELRDRFLATISHELRTPLNAIVGWAHLLQTGSVRDSGKALVAIERNAALQAHLIDNLLDVSRVARQRFPMVMSPVDIGAITRDAVAAMAAVAAGKQVELVVDDDDGPVVVLGDDVRLQQVVTNLLINAVKFSRHGGGVRISVSRAGGSAHIVVRDAGEGIDGELLAHVFEPFQQGQSGGPLTGVGLGLAVVQEIVERHGGRVTAQSAGPGTGAEFSVVLPLCQKDRHQDADGDATARQTERGAPIEDARPLSAAPRV
jgi:signal transduction histidine kinase